MTSWTALAEPITIPHLVGQLTCYLAEPKGAPARLAFLIHGRNGAARQPHMEALARAYLRAGWCVAAPDLPYSAATPALGSPTDITFDAHVSAARLIIDRLKKDVFAEKPLAICGHSLGAFAAAQIATDQEDLHHLMAVSPVLSGQNLLDARTALGQSAVDAMAKEAPKMFDKMATETCAPSLRRLNAPLAVMTGALDGLTPPHHARAFFAAAPNARFFSLLPGLHHCPVGTVFDRALMAAFDALGT